MKMRLHTMVVCLLILFSCKKNNVKPAPANAQLFPLMQGNQWVYADSFFDVDGTYAGLDTFRLHTADAVVHNNALYTPITDQYDDAIFIMRSDDSKVYVWKPAGAALLFTLPLPPAIPYINNSYSGDSLTSIIYTNKISTLGYPSYKVVVTQDDGLWYHYMQDEYFFSIGIGIIKGNTKWKDSNGSLYISDSYHLTYYYVK